MVVRQLAKLRIRVRSPLPACQFCQKVVISKHSFLVCKFEYIRYTQHLRHKHSEGIH